MVCPQCQVDLNQGSQVMDRFMAMKLLQSVASNSLRVTIWHYMTIWLSDYMLLLFTIIPLCLLTFPNFFDNWLLAIKQPFDLTLCDSCCEVCLFEAPRSLICRRRAIARRFTWRPDEFVVQCPLPSKVTTIHHGVTRFLVIAGDPRPLPPPCLVLEASRMQMLMNWLGWCFLEPPLIH